MRFSEAKLTNLKPQKEKGLFTFLVALGVAAAFFVPYMVLSEGYFTFYGDFNVQMIPFYQEVHQAVHEGNIFWSHNTDLGANFIGSYSYYALGSPFFWLTIPFPNSFVPYLMGPLMILKFACAAFTAYLYIRRFTKTPYAACLGGLLYAFSGFSVYNIFFFIFHEAIIFFPLLLLALELFITENRRGVFCLAVALCAIVNYFFFFGMVVFCIIYFFVRLFSKAIKIRFTRFLCLMLEAVLGLGISAALLLPSIAAVSGNSRISEILIGWNGITYGKEQIYLNILECFFFPPDLPARPVFFPEARVEWSSLGGWLPLFSMAGVFTFFTTRKRSWVKRVIGICIFMALVPFLNSSFYAFNQCYYARWFYMPILIMSLATAVMAEDAEANWKFGWRWVFGITVAAALVFGFFPQKDPDGEGYIFGLYTYEEGYTYVIRYWVTCAIAIISLIVLYLLLKIRKTNKESFLKGSIACVCIVSIIFSNVFVATGRQHSYDIHESVIPDLIEGNVDLPKDEFYRIDTYDGIDNTGMYLGYPSINAFHSVVPQSIVDFYSYIGIERSVASRPETHDVALRSLLSVKYLLNRTDGDSFIKSNGEPQMAGFNYIGTMDGYYVYENQNFVPMGFCYDYFMTEDYSDHYYNEFKTFMMVKAVILTKEQIAKYSSILDNFADLKLDLVYDYNDYENATENNNSSDSAYSTDEDSITEPEQEPVPHITSTSVERLAIDSENLRNNAVSTFKTDNDGFTATITRDKKSLLFFSIPYDEGWSATVNGEKAEIERVNKGFMAVVVPEGESTIRFDYRTPLLLEGIGITIVSVGIFLVYFLVATIYIRKKHTRTVYPEGEMLLGRWHKEDIADAAAEFYALDEDHAPKSILFDDDVTPPTRNKNFSGGFTIDSDLFDNKE